MGNPKRRKKIMPLRMSPWTIEALKEICRGDEINTRGFIESLMNGWLLQCLEKWYVPEVLRRAGGNHEQLAKLFIRYCKAFPKDGTGTPPGWKIYREDESGKVAFIYTPDDVVNYTIEGFVKSLVEKTLTEAAREAKKKRGRKPQNVVYKEIQQAGKEQKKRGKRKSK